MKPYGVSLKDRRKIFDYRSDKYNTRGCFNKCSCSNCRSNKSKIRIHTARKRTNLIVNNIKRAAKKKARQLWSGIKRNY